MDRKRLYRIAKHLRKVVYICATLTFLLVQLAPSVAHAELSQADVNAIYQWPLWDPSTCTAGGDAAGAACCGGTDTPTTLTGTNPNQITPTPAVKTAFAFLLSKGYNAVQTAGIVGNLMYESDHTTGGIDPTKNEEGGGGGYGIAQWAPPDTMRNWVIADGGNPNSLKGQLDYLVYDLNHDNSGASAAVKATTTIEDATAAFMNDYERPLKAAGIASLPDRVADATAAYNAGGGSTTGGGGGGGDGGCTAVNAGCKQAATVTGNSKILAEAECFNGLYYEYGGGHEGYAAFIKACPDPTNPPNPPGNHPTGGPSIDGGLSGNPSPCATDCSALVSIAVDMAFKQTFNWTVAGIEEDTADWRQIDNMSTVQPGDVVTIGPDDHVEIVDHYVASSDTLYTFGSHETGTRTSQVTSSLHDPWTGAYRYIGPGSNNE